MTGKSKFSILFLGKKNDEHCQKAQAFIDSNFETKSCHAGGWGEPLPPDLESWRGDYIVSYLSRWVVPESVLKRAKIAAINFHPASPDYPGIGCNNFALYENAKEYGVTCHHMEKKVDTGGIISVKRFPVFQTDTVSTLLSRTYDFQLVLFYEVMAKILEGDELPRSEDNWTRPPFSRREFNKLGIITPDMPISEIEKRVRATSYGAWQPTIEMGGYVFQLRTDDRYLGNRNPANM